MRSTRRRTRRASTRHSTDSMGQLPAARRRRQPLRRCKKCRWENCLRLLDLPTDVIREVLEFSMPEQEQERWLWIGQVGSVCHVFHEIAKELSPTELDLMKAFEDLLSFDHLGKFLESLLIAPWKAAKLTNLTISDGRCFSCGECRPLATSNDRVLAALRALLTTPGALRSVESLVVSLHSGGPYVVDTPVLVGLPQSLPKLKHLHLSGVCQDAYMLAPSSFALFGQKLQQPLESLVLRDVSWLQDEHMQEFLRYQGAELTKLEIRPCWLTGERPATRPIDGTLATVERLCPRLRSLSLTHAGISKGVLDSFLRTRGTSLRHLDLARCPNLGNCIIESLVQFAPNLETLCLKYCHWFTNEELRGLVNGLLDQSKSGRISLRRVEIYGSQVTPSGAIEGQRIAFPSPLSVTTDCRVDDFW